MFRIYYALKEGFRCRWKIRAIARSPETTLRCITELTPEHLHRLNITHLALDFDGVLAAHGERAPRLEVSQWLADFIQKWPAGKIYLLTNCPKPERFAHMQRNWPTVEIISGFSKKPYPEGLLHIASTAKVNPEVIVLVDDRLLTGMLACCLAGTQAIYITKPYACFWRRPLHEMFFGLLRFTERLFWK